ncbi:phosphatase PAP2 family protein [Chengkuizengella axinellae]|uniref:Phosphatase PAP2 family protein n=1 Tax=Chengkuizengella axinellae TaxID=3064388 RepID=A0ABT9IUE2_9BACL|nr:phosphatase PAP2 family protein [Chengkuizengella sp. 2205SS18-9]MDP5272979.1 phosphatase PAP2 family protein [Chengkuizengella sp. 2205SS18-9]
MAQISRQGSVSGKTQFLRNRFIILILISVISFAAFSILLYTLDVTEPSNIDKKVLNWMSLHAPTFLLGYLTALTETVSYRSIPIVILLVMIWFGWRKKDFIAVIIFPIAVVGSEILKILIKNSLQRPRPEINAAVDGTGFSFPSGHAFVGLVCYGLLAFFILKYTNRFITRILIALFFILFIASIGFSRIYFSVHYVTDIMASYFLGITFVCASIFIYESLTLKLNKK